MQSSPNTQQRPLRRLNYRTSCPSNSPQAQKRAPARPRLISSSHLSASRADAQSSASKETIDSFCPYGGLNFGSTSSNGNLIADSNLNNYGSGVRVDSGKFVSTANFDNNQRHPVTTDIRIQSKEESKRAQERRITQLLAIGLAAFMLILTGIGMLWMHQSNTAAQASDIVTTYSNDDTSGIIE